jgi:hypothetical protein
MPTTLNQLGNGNGILYEVDQGGVITAWRRNSPDGIRDMRQKAAAMSPLAAKRSGYATIRVLTVASAGAFSNVDVNTINQLGGNVNVLTGDPATEAARLSAGINAFTPPSGPRFTSQAVNDYLYLIEPEAVAGQFNGVFPVVSVTDPSITVSIEAFKNGAGASGSYDVQFGRAYYLNAEVAASPGSLSGAIEISDEFIVRSASSGIPSIEHTLDKDRITGIRRYNNIIHFKLDTESAAPEDYLVAINPIKFIDSDLLLISAADAVRTVTIKDVSTAASVSSTPDPNIYLASQADFVSTGPVGNSILLQYRYTTALGGHFVEIMRTSTPGCINISTWAALNALRTAGGLQQGCKYLIADALSGYGQIIVSAAHPTRFEEDAEGIFLNADYQQVGDYSGVSGFGSQLGVWHPAMSTPLVGDACIYDNMHYRNLTGAVGTEPAFDIVNWVVLSKSLNNGYIREVDTVSYQFVTNQIVRRMCRRGNIVEIILPFGNPNIHQFCWGNDRVLGNYVAGAAIVNTQNVIGYLNHNQFYGGVFEGNVIGADATINANTMHNGEFTQNSISGPNASISDNVLFNGRIISNGPSTSLSVSGNTLYDGAEIFGHNGQVTIVNNKLYGDSGIRVNAGIGTIANNELYGQSSLVNSPFTPWSLITPSAYDINPRACSIDGNTMVNLNDHISGNRLGPNAVIRQNVIASGKAIYSNELNKVGIISCAVNAFIAENEIDIGLNAVTVGNDIYRKTQKAAVNDISYASFAGGGIDITGATTITIPAGHLEQVGIIPLTSSNATEAVDTVSGMSGKTTRIRFIPVSGFSVRFSQTPAPGAAGKFVMPDVGYDIDGTNGDYIEFEVRNQIFYYINHRIAT